MKWQDWLFAAALLAVIFAALHIGRSAGRRELGRSVIEQTIDIDSLIDETRLRLERIDSTIALLERLSRIREAREAYDSAR